MPIVNLGREVKVSAQPAQEFGSYPKIGKTSRRFTQKNADQICVLLRKFAAGFSHALDDHRDALSTADTSSSQTVAFSAAVKLMQHRQNETRTSRSQRMPECNRAAVDVCPAAVESQLFLDCQILSRKSLIHFDQIDVV